MYRFAGLFAAFLILVGSIHSPAQAQDKSLTVFAAASMKNALDAVDAAYTAKTNVKISASYAASSALAKQLEQGAPADIFVSADTAWMDYSIKKDAINASTRVDLLESAGAAKAEVLINAIDDPETSMQMVELVKEHFPGLTIISRARDVDHYIRLRQAGVEAPERETFEGALKSGRMALENLGLGAYEARERADLFRRFNTEMVEEMAAMAGSTATERAAVFKRTSAMLTEIINEDRNHLSLIQRHGWQGTEEGKHTGDPADEPESKPSA